MVLNIDILKPKCLLLFYWFIYFSYSFILLLLLLFFFWVLPWVQYLNCMRNTVKALSWVCFVWFWSSKLCSGMLHFKNTHPQCASHILSLLVFILLWFAVRKLVKDRDLMWLSLVPDFLNLPEIKYTLQGMCPLSLPPSPWHHMPERTH